MVPIEIATRRKLFGNYDGFAFFIFIFYWEGVQDKRTILRHERIHFWQQVELLFVIHWLLYAIFYIVGRIQGKNHDAAYRNIPFEKEAYTFERQPDYLTERKLFAWIGMIGR